MVSPWKMLLEGSRIVPPNSANNGPIGRISAAHWGSNHAEFICGVCLDILQHVLRGIEEQHTSQVTSGMLEIGQVRSIYYSYLMLFIVWRNPG